jgi:hypothetical protein
MEDVAMLLDFVLYHALYTNNIFSEPECIKLVENWKNKHKLCYPKLTGTYF